MHVLNPRNLIVYETAKNYIALSGQASLFACETCLRIDVAPADVPDWLCVNCSTDAKLVYMLPLYIIRDGSALNES